MCKICKEANSLNREEVLKRIAIAVKSGKEYDHFREVIDSLLGTKPTAVDEDLDSQWEKGKR